MAYFAMEKTATMLMRPAHRSFMPRSNGVPLVAIPITNDEPAAAARIEWRGVGRSVHIKRLTVARLRTAIEQVLAGPSYRENARRLQREIAGLNPLERAIEVIESVLTD